MRLRNLRRAAVVLFVLAVGVGCAPVPIIQVDEGLASVPPSEAGYLAGSMSKLLRGEESSPFGHHWIWVREKGSRKTVRLGFSHNGLTDTPPEFDDKTIRGATFRIPLPPGEYEIFSVRFYYNNGQMEKTFYSEEPFTIPITVQKGKTTYLGEFLAHGVWGRNFLGFKIPVGGYYAIRDQHERDFALLSAKYGDFDGDVVEVAIPVIPPELFVFFRPSVAQQGVQPDA